MTLIPMNYDKHCFIPCDKETRDGGLCTCYNGLVNVKSPIFKNHTDILTDEDFRWYAEDVLDELMQDIMGDNRYSYELDPEDEDDAILIDLGGMYAFTRKGMNLLTRTQDRLSNLYVKHFGKEGECLDPIQIPGLIEE